MSTFDITQNLGFTGSRHGMTEEQITSVVFLIRDLMPFIKLAYHGGCVGSDEEFDYWCGQALIPTVVWPASDVDSKWVSKKKLREGTTLVTPRPAMERNEIIVRECSRIIATPNTYDERQRSGT